MLEEQEACNEKSCEPFHCVKLQPSINMVTSATMYNPHALLRAVDPVYDLHCMTSGVVPGSPAYGQHGSRVEKDIIPLTTIGLATLPHHDAAGHAQHARVVDG